MARQNFTPPPGDADSWKAALLHGWPDPGGQTKQADAQASPNQGGQSGRPRRSPSRRSNRLPAWAPKAKRVTDCCGIGSAQVLLSPAKRIEHEWDLNQNGHPSGPNPIAQVAAARAKAPVPSCPCPAPPGPLARPRVEPLTWPWTHEGPSIAIRGVGSCGWAPGVGKKLRPLTCIRQRVTAALPSRAKAEE